MATVDENMTQDSRPTGIGPGERLQAARIQAGLSLEDVAARMHLSIGILEAIEENNFEEITAPIFVKGYLRAYARIVSLDEDEMIQQYMQYYSGEDPPISATGNVAPELSVTDARIRWTTYLVIVVLAVLLAAWWWNKARDEEPAISLDAQPATEQGENAVAQDSGSEIQAASESVESSESSIAGMQAAVPQTEAEPEPEPEPEPIDASSETASDEVALAATESSAQETTALETTAVEAEAVETEAPEPEPAEVASAEVEPPPAIPNTPGLIAPSGSDRMRIIVSADTWADIKDSSGYQMVYDLLRADQSLELIGAAPFSVFLGNGHGVEILVNDEEFDFSSRIRNDNTARLKVGG